MSGAKGGRVELVHTFATAQTITFDDSASVAHNVVVPAGDYTASQLLTYLIDNIAGGGNWSLTADWGEGASVTGKVTITTSDTPFSITWTSGLEARDALGFSWNAAGVSAAQTGAYHARGVFLPRTPKYSIDGDDDAGTPVTSVRHTVGPTGVVYSLGGPQYTRLDGLRWDGVVGSRVRAHLGAGSYGTFEDFYLDATTGRLASLPVGCAAMLIWDADNLYDQATGPEGRLLWPTTLADLARPLVDGWVGRYVVTLPPLIVEGS